MRHKLLTSLTVVACACGAAFAWSHYHGSRLDARPLDTNDAVPGRLLAYRLTFPFDDMNTVVLEIRRVSSPNDHKYTVGSVDGNLRISREDAELIISTSLISSTKIHDEILVSTLLLEVDKLLVNTSSLGDWVVAGRLAIPGVNTDFTPKENFCLGGALSIGWERNPNWRNNEICVGRFRSHDEHQVYDYYCVVVAGNSESRQ